MLIHRREAIERAKLNSTCNTIISTLFVVLFILLTLFICDLSGLVQLDKPLQYVSAANAIKDQIPERNFISVSQTVTLEPLQGQHIDKVKVIKPIIDHRQYRYLELENHLKVLLIHDPESEMASAAMDVKAGSWNEPDEYPGLAHFCEHMLFIGSQKYSKIFLSLCGGISRSFLLESIPFSSSFQKKNPRFCSFQF